jgi:hypothetical protein
MAEIKRGVNCGCGVDFWKKTTTWSEELAKMVPTYECPNCGERAARKVLKRGTKQTPAQTAMVERIVNRMRAPQSDGSYRYEVKEQETKMTEHGDLWLTIVTGMPNDAGKLSSVFCRNRLHVLIRRAGGLTSFAKGAKMVKGWRKVMTQCVEY